MAEKEGKPTLYNVIRADIDAAIADSNLPKQFYEEMHKRGYEFKFGKYTAVRPLGRERFTRLKTLGEDYDMECICERIREHGFNSDRYYRPRQPIRNKTYKLTGTLKGKSPACRRCICITAIKWASCRRMRREKASIRF
jgi:hypothetical protein